MWSSKRATTFLKPRNGPRPTKSFKLFLFSKLACFLSPGMMAWSKGKRIEPGSMLATSAMWPPTRCERVLASSCICVHLRAPDETGTWKWGSVCGIIELPKPVVEALAKGAVPQAPTLREIRSDDGSRVAVLDLILEVGASSVGDLEQQTRVLGWDWGVRSLITVSILEKTEGAGDS